MDCSAFATLLRKAISSAFAEFVRARPADRPYAFTLISGQGGHHLGYAVATENGLLRVAAEYEARGYRYQGWEWEDFDNREKLAIWLRWANPDDGWEYCEFPKDAGVQSALAQLVEAGAFGHYAGGLEEFCTEVLSSLQQDRVWQASFEGIIVGVTCGEDPRDFLRTATRANPYPIVKKLWGEHWQGEELSRRIPAPK